MGKEELDMVVLILGASVGLLKKMDRPQIYSNLQWIFFLSKFTKDFYLIKLIDKSIF